MMRAEEALAFVREHGAVLVSAKGPLPRLTEAIVGQPIRGSWWAHAQSRAIFRVLQSVTDSEQVFVCRLVGGKVTILHDRVLPALVRLAGCFPPERIARVRDVHTSTGQHVSEETPYPEWVTPELKARAQKLSERQAEELLGAAVIST